jgi:5-formyltetrahydrofolate cyclo-ligase
VVPAVGIDAKGHRLGWGHGYFDRLLSTAIPHRIGIIFDCQRMSDHIKSDPWDISLTGIITERQLFNPI